MDAKKFAENFEHVVSGRNGINELNGLILQLAVRGRLTGQDDSESAISIMNRIAEEKGKLAQKNDIKRNSRPSEIKELQEPFEIPATWVWERLENITEVNMGQSPDSSSVNDVREGIPFYQGKSEFGDIFPTPRKWCTAPKKIANKGDILISVRAPVGPTNLCVETSCIGRGLAALKPLGGILSYYVLYGLRAFAETFATMGTGSTFTAINSKDIKSFLFPVPPITEQQRIIDRIEELMTLCGQLKTQQNQFADLQAKTNAALLTDLTNTKTRTELDSSWHKFESHIADLLNTAKNVEALKEAIRTLAVSGKLESFEYDSAREIIEESLAQKKKLIAAGALIDREKLSPLAQDETTHIYPSHWSIARFDDLAVVTGGITKGRKLGGRRTSTYPYLRAANVQRGYLLLEDIHEIEVPSDEYEKYVLSDGDILIVEGGDWDKVGRTAIWSGQLQDCLHQNHVFKARMFSNYIEKEWIQLIFNSSIGRQYWTIASKQTTNLASINMTQVRNFPIPIPSQDEQRHILYTLNSLVAACDDLIKIINETRAMQENFSRVAIQSVLQNKISDTIMVNKNLQTKRLEKRVNSELTLTSPLNNDLVDTVLAKILQAHDGKLEAKELWKASQLRTIDDFYALLKKEIEAGAIQEPTIATIKMLEVAE